jgi:hypothetical protein
MTRLNKYLEREVYKMENNWLEKRDKENKSWQELQDCIYINRKLSQLIKETDKDDLKIILADAFSLITKKRQESLETLFDSVDKKWVLEYSVSQNCFNVDTKERILQKNRSAMYEKISNDYKIIEEYETEEEALEAASKLRKKIPNED